MFNFFNLPSELQHRLWGYMRQTNLLSILTCQSAYYQYIDYVHSIPENISIVEWWQWLNGQHKYLGYSNYVQCKPLYERLKCQALLYRLHGKDYHPCSTYSFITTCACAVHKIPNISLLPNIHVDYTTEVHKYKEVQELYYAQQFSKIKEYDPIYIKTFLYLNFLFRNPKQQANLQKLHLQDIMTDNLESYGHTLYFTKNSNFETIRLDNYIARYVNRYARNKITKSEQEEDCGRNLEQTLDLDLSNYYNRFPIYINVDYYSIDLVKYIELFESWQVKLENILQCLIDLRVIHLIFNSKSYYQVSLSRICLYLLRARYNIKKYYKSSILDNCIQILLSSATYIDANDLFKAVINSKNYIKMLHLRQLCQIYNYKQLNIDNLEDNYKKFWFLKITRIKRKYNCF